MLDDEQEHEHEHEQISIPLELEEKLLNTLLDNKLEEEQLTILL